MGEDFGPLRALRPCGSCSRLILLAAGGGPAGRVLRIATAGAAARLAEELDTEGRDLDFIAVFTALVLPRRQGELPLDQHR